MDHLDANGPAESEWFYELGGRIHGPLSWPIVEELLGRCGDTAFDIRIRKGPDGPWLPYRAPAVTAMQGSAVSQYGPTASVEAGSPGIKPAHRRSRFQITFPRSTAKYSLGLVAAVLWCVTNVILLFFWPQPFGAERRAILALKEIQTRINELSVKRAPESEWSEFRERSKGTLAPVVRDLQRAESSEPAQLLLLASRDLVPKLCSSPEQQRGNYQWRFQRCLDRSELILSGLQTD